MSKTFRLWDVDQSWLLPGSVHDFVPPGHLAHFVRDTVREGSDLSAILLANSEERGQPPPARPRLRGTHRFHGGAGSEPSGFRTISDFRKRHLPALSDLFVQVLRLCQRAGLVKLGHVAVDGTKLRANASRHKAMSYQRMVTKGPKLAAEVKAWLDEAEAADQAEDAQHGRERRGDEMPESIEKSSPVSLHAKPMTIIN